MYTHYILHTFTNTYVYIHTLYILHTYHKHVYIHILYILHTHYKHTCMYTHSLYTTYTHTLHTRSLMGPWPHTVASLCLAWPQVTYLPFTEAFDQARAKNRLVHSILLWGALDDQSC